MSFKLISTINAVKVEATILDTSLPFTTIKTMCGMAAFLFDTIPEDTLQIEVQGSTVQTVGSAPRDSFTWNCAMGGLTVTHVIKCEHYSIMDVYQVTSKSLLNVDYQHVHTSCANSKEGEEITMTFRNGMLESIGDQPAYIIRNYITEWSAKLWFHHNKCYRPAFPDKPAKITQGPKYCISTHYNANGEIHRAASKGPAVYHIVDGECRDAAYYLNGQVVNRERELTRELEAGPGSTDVAQALVSLLSEPAK